MHKTFNEKKAGVKLARDRFLRMHKVLMEWERGIYESEHGTVTPGQFLELLLSDPRFEWLRVLSMLIVRIDEAFDLDDGLSNEMIEGFRTEIRDILEERSGEYGDFKARMSAALPLFPEVSDIRSEILNLLEWEKDA